MTLTLDVIKQLLNRLKQRKFNTDSDENTYKMFDLETLELLDEEENGKVAMCRHCKQLNYVGWSHYLNMVMFDEELKDSFISDHMNEF